MRRRRSHSAPVSPTNEVRTAFATVHPGLELALADELTDLGLEVRVTKGGVTFRGTSDAVALVHLWSRIAGRVLVRVASVRARNLEGLAQAIRLLPWRIWVWPNQPIEVDVTLHRSRLPRKDAVARKVALAIRDSLRGPRLPGPRPPREPVRVKLRAVEGKVTVSIDATGDRLHRRGWRLATAKAPLRENLAAAVLRLADWDPGETLVDPMCGSGTFALEAAGISVGRAPGLDRTFAFHRWPSVELKTWTTLSNDARSRPPVALGQILAADQDPGAIRAAVANAERARQLSNVRFVHETLTELVPPDGPRGLVVINPPYGRRIKRRNRSRLYRHIGQVLRERWDGWRVAILVPDPSLGKPLGLPLRKVGGFSNGGIPVTLLLGEVPSAVLGSSERVEP